MPIPAALKKKKKKLSFAGDVDGFVGDTHAITIDPRGASNVLAQEDDFDAERFEAIGFFADLPLVADTSSKKPGVFVLADGELVVVARSLDAFVKGCAEPKEDASVAGAGGPKKIVSGPKPAKWPKGNVLVPLAGGDSKHFLSFHHDRMGRNKDLLYTHLGKGRSAKAKWAVTTCKHYKRVGGWVDFARLDLTFVCTPRAKARMEAIQSKGLEFLPFRANVNGNVANVFVANPTLLVACLDAKASALPPRHDLPWVKDWQALPEKLVVRAKAIPEDPCFFRPEECPQLVLATGAMVEALRSDGFSGLDFVVASKWRA